MRLMNVSSVIARQGVHNANRLRKPPSELMLVVTLKRLFSQLPSISTRSWMQVYRYRLTVFFSLTAIPKRL
jgi:hypothetical protein